MLKRSRIVVRYLWAAPASVVGLLIAAVACPLGATPRLVDGVMEVAGGRLLDLARATPGARRFVAITFGHVVLGHNHKILSKHRAHEHAHVRQYERWGLLFFPLYLGSSLWQLSRGHDPYWDNRFERQARDAAAKSGQCLHRPPD